MLWSFKGAYLTGWYECYFHKAKNVFLQQLYYVRIPLPSHYACVHLFQTHTQLSQLGNVLGNQPCNVCIKMETDQMLAVFQLFSFLQEIPAAKWIDKFFLDARNTFQPCKHNYKSKFIAHTLPTCETITITLWGSRSKMHVLTCNPLQQTPQTHIKTYSEKNTHDS